MAQCMLTVIFGPGMILGLALLIFTTGVVRLSGIGMVVSGLLLIRRIWQPSTL